jgi:hypothetical protein
MGFLDSILGGSKKEELQEVTAAPGADSFGDDIPPEHIAAIAAAIAAVYTNIPEEHIAVIAAAIAAYEGTARVEVVPVINIQRGLNIWAMTGRQEAMAARKLQ